MKSGVPFKRILLAFVAAVVVYAAIFYLIEHQRTRRGPWRVAFASAGGGSHPVLIINEPSLNISDLKITFPARSAPATNAIMIFDQPRDVPFDVPFGQCIFQDLISQPGTVTFKLFDHEIELLPRVLRIDRKEHVWQSGTNIEVVP